MFDSGDLPNVFSDYFTEKIRTIRNNFPPPNPTACPDSSFAGNPLLANFERFTDEFVLKIINSAPAKSCELDPIPTTLIYENRDILLPTSSTSFTAGFVSPDLKIIIVKPLLKKPSLDIKSPKNNNRRRKKKKKKKKREKKPAASSLNVHFCPKSLIKSFFTRFSPISKKTI